MSDWEIEPFKELDNVPRGSVRWGRLFGYLKPYRLRMAAAIGALCVSSAVGLLFPLVIVQLLETVLNDRRFESLNMLALGLMGLFFVQAVFTFIESYNLSYIGERIILDLRTGLYRRLQTLSLDFYATRRTGELISRMSSDVTQVRTMLTSSVTSLLGQVVSLVGSIVIVFLLNPSLTAFILILVPILLVVAFSFGRPLQRVATRVQDELAGATAAAEEGLQGIRIVKSFAREDYEIARYEGAMRRTFKQSMRLAIFRSLFAAAMAFLGFGSIGAILWFGGREVLEGRLTLPMISGFLIYGFTIAANLGGLAGFYTSLREALGSIRRVFELLDTQPSVTDAPDARSLPAVAGRINFEGVSFSYDDRMSVLKHITLDIAPGEVIALVGPSGAGKSTLFNLIPRFYDPSAGAVCVDGVNVRSVTMHSLRAQIGIVPQETLLFSGNIHDNIAYGRLEASETDIIAAAKAANAHDFIMDLPDGYKTVVGERGVRLSGGQRQRVAIARAILKDPRILLLDEATSSLDSESEELVQDALERLMQGRTTVIIAHRLSTIKIAHRIVVLDKGEIVELGTHDELLAHNGLYARLYQMQFREPEMDSARRAALQPEREERHAEQGAEKRRTGTRGLLDALSGPRDRL